MKLKKLLKTLCLSSTLLLSAVSFSSCSAFFDTEEGSTIKEILTEITPEGDTKITIVYLDEEMEPVEFIVQKGDDGIVGNGIETITQAPSSDGNSIILTITFTDGSEPKLIEVPVINGKDGVSISGIETVTNLDGSQTVTIKFEEDALEPVVLNIPAPIKGDTGNGIASLEVITNEDKSQTITITYTDTTMEPTVVTVPAPEKGDPGRGILYMTATEKDNQYVLTVYYSDGTMDELKFTKPTEPNTWHAGYQNPNDISIGRSGDFYLDKTTMIVYQKNGNKWVQIACLSESKETHTVTFNANGGIFGSEVISPDYEITHGYSFYSTPGLDMPSIFREDYTFLGWYTSPNMANVNSGQFTDLTPVLCDMTLYAWWEAK